MAASRSNLGAVDWPAYKALCILAAMEAARKRKGKKRPFAGRSSAGLS